MLAKLNFNTKVSLLIIKHSFKILKLLNFTIKIFLILNSIKDEDDLSRKKGVESGSLSQRYGSADLDPFPNVTGPMVYFLCRKGQGERRVA
jgi:hypothetical protein